MPRSIDEWARDRNRSSGGSVGSSIVGAVGGKTGDGSISGSIVGTVGGQSGGSVGGSIAGAVQQQTGQSGGQGSPRSIEEWAQDQQGSRPQTLDEGQRLYEQRKQAQAEAKPWMKTLLWLGEMSNQAEQARLGQQIHPQENATTWEDVKDAWEASRKANRAADYAGRDNLIKEYNAARHEMGAQRHTPEPEVQRRYEQARDRLYEQERIHGNIGLNANGELQTMSYSFGEGVGNVIGGTMGRVIGGVGSAATWLGEAAARSEYAKSAANLREMAAFYAMAGNDNASEGAYRMADTLTQRAAQRGNLAEFGGAYDFFDKQAAAGNRLVQAAKENQRPVVQMGVDVGSTALEMGFDAVSGSPLVSMGVRVFGGASQEAREAGAGFLQQGAYGAASASIEVMTEMIGGLKLYGGGQLDEVLEPALREIAGTPGGYALLRAMYTMAQEGNEEVLSDLLQPIAQSIYNGQSVGENYSQLELQDILYDWLLGAAAAFGGAVVESGGYAQDYTAMREMQQDLNAQGVETGRMTDEQLRQAYTLDKAGVNVAGLQSAENRAVGGETIGEAYENMTPEQRQEAVANMLTANAQQVRQTPTDEITRETAQEILRESLGEREAESAERILDLGSESNLREQAIAYHTIATEYGQTEGRSVEDALRSNVRGALNDTQVQHAYAYGESLRKSGQTVGVNGQITEQGAQTAKPVRRAGLVTAGTFEDGNTTYKAADLSKADARDLRILNDIAKAQGVDFVLYESKLGEADAEGRRSYIGANGAYRNGVVYLDINAGLTGERTEGGKTYTIGQRALLVTAAHELTHHLEHSNPTMYRQLRSFVTERLGGSDSFIGYVKDAMAREDISVEAASREVVARACEEVLLDENAIREMQGKKPTLWEQIKEWVKDFVKKFESASGEAVEMRQYANELRRLWLGAAKEAQESAGGTADVVFAEGAAKQTGSGADISHSLRENNNITARTMAYLGKHPAAHISAEMIETANGIINEMTDYMLPYLDKDNTLGRHYLPEEVLGTTIFSDSSYGKSVENTTICFRTLAYIDFTNEIKKRIGRPLTVQESFLASQMLYDIAKEPQCLYCYVSLDRKAYDEFLGKYLKQRDGVLKAFGELSSEEQTKIVEALRGIAPEEKGAAAVYARIPLYAEFLKDESGKKRKNTAPMRQRFGLWISAAAGGKGFITAKDLTTAETRNALKEGELAEQVLDAERYAQAASWAKKLEEYRAYNGNILNMSQETVDKLNESYGLRFYSFSEYSAAFIVENMQQIRDAAAKGLYGLAYTKKPDFARIFAGTGININISTFGRWGVDAQGKRVVVMDDLQGANWDEVKQLRDDFKNVGAVFVATDDAMVDWALAQDWIDVVIPFHIVRTGADVANFYKWVVHNQDQADKTKKGKAKDITPPEHQNDRATFLALAKERGLTPRFSKWLGNEHYMKLVNETRQPTKNSTPLKPVFDLKAAKQSFDDFVDEGGYYGNWYKEKTEQTGPVAYSYEEAVDQVVSDVKAGRKANEVSYGRQDIDVVAENFGKARQNAPRAHGQAMGPTTQHSVRDREYSDAVARGDMETAQQMVDEAAKAAGYTVKAFHGTRSFGFTVFDPSRADDGISLFATSNRRTAETYSGETNRERIKDRETKNADDLHGEQLIEEAKNHKKRYQDYSLMSDKDKATVRDDAKSSIEWSIRRAQEFVRDHRDAFDSEKSYIMDRLISSLYHLRDFETEADISEAWTEWEDALWDLKGMDDSIAVEFLEDVDSRGLFQSKNELDDMTYQGDMYADWYAGGPDYIFDNQLQIELNAEYHKGIYELWCKPGRQLLIDSNGENWNQITPPKELQDYGLYGPQRTRDIATAAKALGYDSVLLRDLRDNGGETAYNGLSDVYIFFDASALKSADPVTYDDNGEVIPLSQRFDSGKDDIRFSVRDNLGYHAGDLGKAEHLRIQGRSRGTGHFGTGTYFVGEAEKVTKDSHYGKRPQHAVDFSDYHLFRVRNDREGYRLHDALRIIDGGVRREWIAPAANHEFNAIDPTGYYKLAQEKYGDNWTRGDNLLNSMLEFAEQNGIKLKTPEEYQAENKTEGDEEDQKFWYQEYVKDTLSKEIKKVNDEYHELMDTFFNLELAFGFKSGKIEAALEAVADYQDATPRDAKADSYATVFMKAMGFEGVDVRGTGLDNTAYGSVIYDVRPETVEYSQREADAMTDREILMLAAERTRERMDRYAREEGPEPPKQIKPAALARILQDKSGTDMGLRKLAERIQEIADADVEQQERMAAALAGDILDETRGEDGRDGEIYRELRARLSQAGLRISDELRGDIADFEDWRRRNGLKLHLRKDGMPIDSFYDELRGKYPGVFPEELAHSDMVQHILDALEGHKPGQTSLADTISKQEYRERQRELQETLLAAVESGEIAPRALEGMSEESWASLEAEEPGYSTAADAETLGYAVEELTRRLQETQQGMFADKELAQFRDAMARYQDYDEAAQEHLQKLGELQQERKAVTDMRTSMGEITPQEKQQRLDALDKQIASVRGKATRAEQNAADALSRVTQLEKGRALQDILQRERAAQRQRTRDKANERLLKRDARKAVEKRAKVLYDMLMKNSDKQHVPEMLKEPLGAFLQGLDFSSNRLLAGGEETKRDAKFGAALLKISAMLNEQQAWINGDEKAKNGDFGAYLDISGENLKFLKDCSELVTEALSENQTFTINQMSGKDLKALSGFLMNLTTAIRKMNSFMANARFESVRAADAADIEHMTALGKASERAGSGLSKTAMWDNGVPYYVLPRFGDGAKSIFDSFAKGWEKMAFNFKEVIDFTAETYTTEEVNAWKREMHDFTLEDGSEIRMTTAQIMQYSGLVGREQAMKHIEQGGTRIGDIKTQKGEIHDTTHYHLTAADISAIVGTLTDRQAEVAEKLHKFMARKGAEWGNEVSMKRFGYRFYTEGDTYVPIETDSNDRPMSDTDAQENSMFRLLNLSSSKPLEPNASNALVVNDIFDVFADHMADMAKLNGLGLPVLDAIKWFNYKERIDRGDGTYDTKTLQGAMEQAFGKQALIYFRTLMKDINGVKENGDRGGDWQGKLISNYKVAAVGANLRVMLLQPTSYVRALTLIKPRYLAGALFKKNAYKEALKYSGTAVWKASGNYDTNISRSMREQIQHNDSFGDKVKEISMTGAEFGDKWTWGGLWVACKMQTRAEKGLSGEELNQATADLFRDVIYSSQVMDSTLTRSQSMRASGKFTKLKTAFMAEPTLSYNILLDAYSQTSLDIRKYGRSEGWKRNTGKMAHAFAVYAISASFSALVESFVDALRDDDDEELVDKFLDRLIGEVDKAGKRALLKGNLMQDLTIIGKIPELKDLISLFQGYGSRDMSVTALGELKDAYEVWRETILLQKGILDKATKTTYYGNMTLWGEIYKTLTALSHLSGYAVSNLTRDALSLWNTFVPSMKIKTYEGRGAAAQAQRYIAAYRAGDRDKMREITESLGADRSGFNSQLSSEIRGDYLAGRITTAQANTMLTELRGLTKIEAQDKLREWDFEKTHGFAYEKLKEQFVEGNVSQAAAVRYIQEVKLKDLDDARNTVLKWQCVKETGIEYDDIKDRLQGGEISVQRAAAYWQKYGGMSEEDATLKANYVAACGATPGLADKLSQDQYKGWYNYARAAGVKVDVYAEIRSTANTDEQSNINQPEAAAAITRALDTRQITRAQAEAVWKSINKGWTTTYAEYVAKHK